MLYVFVGAAVLVAIMIAGPRAAITGVGKLVLRLSMIGASLYIALITWKAVNVGMAFLFLVVIVVIVFSAIVYLCLKVFYAD